MTDFIVSFKYPIVVTGVNEEHASRIANHQFLMALQGDLGYTLAPTDFVEEDAIFVIDAGDDDIEFDDEYFDEANGYNEDDDIEFNEDEYFNEEVM